MPPPIPPKIITASNVDLSNCDREQVQFSGAVQPHGCMLIIDELSLVILQASTNTQPVLGLVPDDLLNTSLEAVLGARLSEIGRRLKRDPLDNGPIHLACLSAGETRSKVSLNLFAHRCGGATILEFEIIPAGAERPILDLYSELRATIAQLQATSSLQSFFDMAVSQIRHFTGFERVMAYKFLEDGSGHVMAESNAEGFAPYLGLHYPASDIPAPARRLFAMAWLRHLPNVDYVPQPLVPERHPATHEPVDLSYSLLRSVSVMYSGYLKNMGVKSTMVMPLMKDGKLWGLISAMHESAPRHVAYEGRMAAEFLAHMLSLMMSAKEDAESFAYRLRMKAALDGMMMSLNERSDLHAGLGGGNGPASIGNYIEADGAALVTEEKVTRFGATPQEHEIRDIAAWLASRADLIMATDRLPEVYPLGQNLAATAAGILAVRLSKRRPEFVMWFRPEQATTVSWAGDPHKPVEIDQTDETGGSVRLRPRTSFAIWKESVQGRARPWMDFEVKAAADLRWAIVEVILARAEETELLNRELKEANVALDSFAYVASHDLKEPLRGIHHMATFIQRGQGDGTQQLETILKLTKRMDDLIESLLQYSRTGRTELNLVECDMEAVLDEALMVLVQRISESNITIRRSGSLPKIKCDRVRLRDVLINLISNAIKYNINPERWVEIGVEADDPPTFFVRDNGIGIAPRDHERVFQIFRRLHGQDEFGGGTGAGLTIAKQSIERHGGRIWIDSQVEKGTTIYFTLQAASSKSRV
jgi:two-component system, chemotaxis family, sensor kinase Cph1